MDEQVYLDEIQELQKEVMRLRQDNARLLFLLRKYINKELKTKKDMALQDYTTEELRAELKRRAEHNKAEREKIDRCRHCKHYGGITHDGREIEDNRISYYPSRSCKFFKTKNGRYFRCHAPSQLACEHFERKTE